MPLFKGFTRILYPLGSESELLCKQLPRSIHTTLSEINFLVQGQLKNTHRVLVLFHCLTANLTFYRLLKPFWKFISLILVWSLRADFCTQALFLTLLLVGRTAHIAWWKVPSWWNRKKYFDKAQLKNLLPCQCHTAHFDCKWPLYSVSVFWINESN